MSFFFKVEKKSHGGKQKQKIPPYSTCGVVQVSKFDPKIQYIHHAALLAEMNTVSLLADAMLMFTCVHGQPERETAAYNYRLSFLKVSLALATWSIMELRKSPHFFLHSSGIPRVFVDTPLH